MFEFNPICESGLYSFGSSFLIITPINNTVRVVSMEPKGKSKIHTKNKAQAQAQAQAQAPHSSFYTILSDKSRGGVLLSKVIYHIYDQNKLNLPLFLTSIGIKASHDLINMINL